jgi:hypothetical protein
MRRLGSPDVGQRPHDERRTIRLRSDLTKIFQLSPIVPLMCSGRNGSPIGSNASRDSQSLPNALDSDHWPSCASSARAIVFIERLSCIKRDTFSICY